MRGCPLKTQNASEACNRCTSGYPQFKHLPKIYIHPRNISHSNHLTTQSLSQALVWYASASSIVLPKLSLARLSRKTGIRRANAFHKEGTATDDILLKHAQSRFESLTNVSLVGDVTQIMMQEGTLVQPRYVQFCGLEQIGL